MRASLFKTIPTRRPTRGSRRGDRPPVSAEHPAHSAAGDAQTSGSGPPDAAAQHLAQTVSPDTAVRRAQDAGGPLDHASYTCSCGYLFLAQVSTTVSCPHCGAGQAW